MEIDYRAIKHIVMLGAGSSVEYGLPTWLELAKLVKKKVADKTATYKYAKEIIEWIDKVGAGGIYSSIDECITTESINKEYHLTGAEIEDEIFSAIKEVFIDSYTEKDDGWIRKLNEKILHKDDLRGSIAFINYNYDDVLDRNFLKINYLSEKERRLTYRDRVSKVSSIVAEVFHPHGFLFFDNPEDQILHVTKTKNTVKTNDEDFHDVVSCHDSYDHKIMNGSYGGFKNGNLYILGLGGGMEINLNKIHFSTKFEEIHVTIRDDKKKERVLEFLSKKFAIPSTNIKAYPTCANLIESCF